MGLELGNAAFMCPAYLCLGFFSSLFSSISFSWEEKSVLCKKIKSDLNSLFVVGVVIARRREEEDAKVVPFFRAHRIRKRVSSAKT